jgi:hypothetical protein
LATPAVSRSIFITGVARTGSTLVSRLVNSLRDVELTSEPSFLFCLFPLLGKIPDQYWRYLLESYLFEEHLMQGLQGRTINLNRGDDGSAWHSKPAAELEARLNVTHRRRDTLAGAETKRIAFKLTDMMPYIPKFCEFYPEATIVVMVRQPDSVIASILAKGWYSNRDLSELHSIWPYSIRNGYAVPFWVPPAHAEYFLGMSEIQRCVFYYTYMYESLAAVPRILFLDYDHLLANPRRVFSRLAERLGCVFGPLTDELLQSVAEPIKDRAVSYAGLDPSLMARMYRVAERCQMMAQTV